MPITINTCYPPNQISPRRAYALGQAVHRAIEDWDSNARVAVVGSGGLSHFVVDEELDRLALELMRTRNAEGIASLPRERLNSATSEIRNWIAASGALEHLEMEVVDYIPARPNTGRHGRRLGLCPLALATDFDSLKGAGFSTGPFSCVRILSKRAGHLVCRRRLQHARDGLRDVLDPRLSGTQ